MGGLEGEKKLKMSSKPELKLDRLDEKLGEGQGKITPHCWTLTGNSKGMAERGSGPYNPFSHSCTLEWSKYLLNEQMND